MSSTSLPLIGVALTSNNWVDVERLCSSALASNPDDEDLLVPLALAMQGQNRLPEAVEILARLTRLYPAAALHWSNYVAVLIQAGRLDDALAALITQTALEPDNPETLIQLGLLHMRLHQYVAARSVLLQAHALNRDSPLARIHAACAYIYCRDYEDADLLLAPWENWLPLDDELQLELGSLLLAQGSGEAARAVIEAVALRSPENIDAKLRLGAAYERINCLPEAQLASLDISSQQLDLSEDQRVELDRLKARLAIREGDLDAARIGLEASGPRAKNDFAHFYSLAGIYDKQNDPQRAMSALRQAHDLQLSDVVSVLPEKSRLDEGIFSNASVLVSESDYANWPCTRAPESAHSPIFIVGFPRSGTTLLEQMLDAHPGLQSMDEKPFISQLAELLQSGGIRVPQDLLKLGQRDCDELRMRYVAMVSRIIPRRWDTQLVDKNPLNMLLLPLIHRLFPTAKFLFILRHPFDVILSCYMQNFRSTALAVACVSLDKLAKTYVSAMESWLHHVSVFKPDVMTLHYEQLVDDLPKQAGLIAKFLNLTDEAALVTFDEHARSKGFIGTPSYTQVIQPINRMGLDRWIAYRDEFERLRPILAPMLLRFGYSSE